MAPQIKTPKEEIHGNGKRYKTQAVQASPGDLIPVGIELRMAWGKASHKYTNKEKT